MSLFQSIPKKAALDFANLCICRQNGVVWDESADSLPQISVAATTIDSRNGNMSNETARRPKNLDVKSNGFVAAMKSNSQQQEDSDVDDGSLPCTPEMETDSDSDVSHSGDEALEADTRQLMSQAMIHFTGRSVSRRTEHKALQTMIRVVNDVLDKHRYAYNGMVKKLSLDNRGDDVRFVGSVAKSLFGDGTTNWGRIASLVAFGAVVCQHLKDTGRENCVESVGEELSKYLLTEQREWLVKNNSWEGFVQFFRVVDPESTVRNTLMAVAGFAGIGATLALLIR